MRESRPNTHRLRGAAESPGTSVHAAMLEQRAVELLSVLSVRKRTRSATRSGIMKVWGHVQAAREGGKRGKRGKREKATLVAVLRDQASIGQHRHAEDVPNHASPLSRAGAWLRSGASLTPRNYSISHTPTLGIPRLR